ncbi:MAG: DNA adenine methylase [Actinomycetota bacterium]|nr:DNA adenine methylase [Actinomycetota bacterium]
MAIRKKTLNKIENDQSADSIAKPFLKWAGGKKQLLQEFDRFFPPELKSGQIDRYFEPFVGGGAVFFYIAQKYNLKSACLLDINKELILTYDVVKRDAENLVELLREDAEEYLSLSEDGRKEYYYKVRYDYNKMGRNFDYKDYSADWIPRAAQMIFLNKTCFNGLFRVNKKGEFNVPFGRYKNPKILDEANLRAASKLLKHTQIKLGDFNEITDAVTKKSFVYFDPPYRPISKTSNFTSYSASDFNDDAQIRLAKLYKKLSRKGTKLMLSNSDPKNNGNDDDFFERHYGDPNIHVYRVPAHRMISCNGAKRGKINELVIINYKIEGL